LGNSCKYRGISLLSTSYKIVSNILLPRLISYIDEVIGIIGVGSDVIDHLERKIGENRAAHRLFIDFEKDYDSVRREVLYSILIEFLVPMKLFRLIKMC
jgi:hypothetical protein